MPQFHVPDMTCKHCEATIRNAIQTLDHEADISIDLPDHLVTIVSKLDAATLDVVLREAGFTPREVL